MPPLDKDQVLGVLRNKGPLVPNDIKKAIGGDTMILGAILSDLSSRGLAKISDVKKGGSPFYYLPGQEAQLEKLFEFLNPKDQETVRNLRENKVIQDKNQELFVRVSLRKAKDYAKQLNVNTSQGPLLFWRYYLINESEAMEILKSRYNGSPQQGSQPPIVQPQPAPSQSAPSQPAPASPPQQPTPQPEPAPTPKPEPKKEEKPAPEPEPKKETVVSVQNAQEQSSQMKSAEKQQSLSAPPRLPPSPFYTEARNYFDKSGIKVIDEKQIAKEREYEFRLLIPSAVGDFEVFCVARNKKKLNQNDVASAVLKAKKHDLQLFYLTNGEFTKKSLGIIAKEYKGVILKQF